jgi:hypothetical protein
MKKILFFSVLSLIVGIFVIIKTNRVKPSLFQEELLRLSENDLHDYIASNWTPIKTKKSDVLRFLSENGYEIDNVVNLPFLEDAKGHRVSGEHPKVVNRYGNNYIRVHLGEYIEVITDEEGSVPYTCDVVVFWIFDENELVHINIWKVWDGT